MPFLTLAHSGVLPCVLAALPTLLHAPPCPCTLLEPPGQVCATPIRSGVGCGTALAAPITLPGGTWGMPGAPEGDGGPMGCHSSRGQQGFGYMGLPLAPTTEGSVQLWVAGGGPGHAAGCGEPQPTSSHPSGAPAATDSCSEAFLDISHVLSVSQMSPGVGGSHLLAAVTHFLPPVLVKPLCHAGVGVGEQQPLSLGHPRIGGSPLGTWAGVSAGQRDQGEDAAP